MPKSKSKGKKKYRQRRVEDNILGLVMPKNMRLADQPNSANVRIKIQDSMTELVMGRGTEADANLLVWSACVAFALTKLREGLGRQFAADIRAGYKAVRRLQMRGEKTGRFVFTGVEKNAVNYLLEIHDVQLQAATVEEIYTSIDYTSLKLCRAGH